MASSGRTLTIANVAALREHPAHWIRHLSTPPHMGCVSLVWHPAPGMICKVRGMGDMEGRLPLNDKSNVTPLRNTGVLPSAALQDLVRAKVITSTVEIESEQYQPASLDLRLGKRAYRVRASFLPGARSTVMERVEQLDGLPAIDLTQGAVLERGAIYVVELAEALALNAETFGVANPKSSTGRVDVLTRLITDRGTAFDRVDYGYKGPLYLEVAPLSFTVVVRPGIKLSQLRIHRGAEGVSLPQVAAEALYRGGQLIGGVDQLRPLREGGLVPVTIDLGDGNDDLVVGYRARKNANKIDLDKVDHYDPRDFWEEVKARNGRLDLIQDEFYILASREDVGVPPQTAAEMVPYDNRSGEFRVHYAGFFDPGFGWADGKAAGSKAVLEVRSHGVSFTLEHGQVIGWLRYASIASGLATKLYGSGVASNYQGQGLRLAKNFKQWAIRPPDMATPDSDPIIGDFF